VGLFAPASWPWRLLAAALALGGMSVAIFADIPEPAPETTVSPGDSLAAPPDTVSIMVLNGSGRAGLARLVQRYLLGQGGATVFVAPCAPADADRDDYVETVIVSHVAGAAAAAAVAGPLGLGDSSIVWELVSGAPADVTIYLGRDVADRRDTLIPFED
jgi:hypothetical protein